MTLVISLDVAELAATRFATSPLGETIRALRLLAKPDPPAVNLPWLRRRQAAVPRHAPRPELGGGHPHAGRRRHRPG